MSNNEGKRGISLRSLSFRNKSRKKKSSDGHLQHRHSVPELTNNNNIASKAAPLCSAVAVQSFTGILRCDLSFNKGDRIDVLTRTDTRFDWWEGRVNGQTGIFPANYVKIVE
ncbi:SH3 domain-containing YSC84-like protein 1 [Patiria miniata]|uniref:SH3 domain-containing YSC84-like protein 1 n=1 Tax=Patiria miniata TaxID=46514 RepID=A0A913ZNS0_PATMI|nr:SH3 domain-containing YSC84-like protein 1 [Patiria miniata]